MSGRKKQNKKKTTHLLVNSTYSLYVDSLLVTPTVYLRSCQLGVSGVDKSLIWTPGLIYRSPTDKLAQQVNIYYFVLLLNQRKKKKPSIHV